LADLLFAWVLVAIYVNFDGSELRKYGSRAQSPNLHYKSVHLTDLILFDFKNYSEAHFSFEGRVNCFLGKNGVGKTNILDAIHYLAFTKSSLLSSDAQNVRHGSSQFIVKGKFYNDDRITEVACSYAPGIKKSIIVDGKETSRLADHIGKYPIVLIAPNDIELIWGGGEMRRKFFDSLISQLNRNYLEQLMKYNHQLRQRNSLLRQADNGRVDRDLLDTYDHNLAETGKVIYQVRREFLNRLLPLFKKHYQFLSGSVDEEVDITYKSDCNDADLIDLLKESYRRDLALQRTCVGVHRDDFVFTLNGHELKRIGSQGQQKSFLIGLKLAEFQSIEIAKGLKPLLLLDDIFDKLDDDRIHKLVSLVVQGTFGQLFITDARPDRSQGLLKEANVQAELFQIEGGKLIEVL